MEIVWKELVNEFPFILNLPDETKKQLQENVQPMQARQGDFLLSSTKTCDFVPLVLLGVLRVFQVGENGREVTLYRAYAGDTCLLNLVCSQEDVFLSAQVMAEEDSYLMLIPKRFFQNQIAQTNAWKDFLISTLYHRLGETMLVLEQMAFTRMDKRLAQTLLRLSNGRNQTISVTHEQLAVELGTAREVISRLLAELRRMNLVVLKRGKIEVLDADALKKMIEDTSM